MLHTQWMFDQLDAWLTGKTIKALMVTPSYVDDPLNIHNREDIVDESTGVGYPAGGVVIDSPGWIDDAGIRLYLSSGPIDFGTIALDDLLGGIVFYVDTGDAATDTILGVDVFELERQIEVTDDLPTIYYPGESSIISIDVEADAV